MVSFFIRYAGSIDPQSFPRVFGELFVVGIIEIGLCYLRLTFRCALAVGRYPVAGDVVGAFGVHLSGVAVTDGIVKADQLKLAGSGLETELIGFGPYPSRTAILRDRDYALFTDLHIGRCIHDPVKGSAAARTLKQLPGNPGIF